MGAGEEGDIDAGNNVEQALETAAISGTDIPYCRTVVASALSWHCCTVAWVPFLLRWMETFLWIFGGPSAFGVLSELPADRWEGVSQCDGRGLIPQACTCAYFSNTVIDTINLYQAHYFVIFLYHCISESILTTVGSIIVESVWPPVAKLHKNK